MIRDKDFKHKTALSPSRIETFLNCSSLYAAKYLYKLPDDGNPGSRRGSTTHDILEILHNPRHRAKIYKALSDETCKNIPALWKLIRAYAKKYKVDNDADLKLVDKFIITALNTEFFGPPGTVEIFSEKTFDFEVETEDGISYRLKGFVDRTFIYQRGNNLYIKIIDWKTSKERFDGEKVLNNNQAICYQLAVVRYLLPEIEMRGFDFIFLKFPKNPIISIELKTKEQLYGYEMWLTHIQFQIDTFSEKNTNDNFAALNQDNKWLCGREGIKKDGSPNWICPARLPLDYYVLLDKDGKISKSSFKNDLIAGEGEKIELRQYLGCSFYFKDGKRRSHNFE